jgi:hypothetical protein
MAEKVFIDIEAADVKLIGDHRDIMLPAKLIEEIQAWCDANNVIAERLQNHVTIQRMFGVTLWRIKDEEQRMWFALKWM